MSKKINKKNPLWGGRFEGSTDSLTQSFSASIDIDKELYAVDIKGSIAYAEALKEAKVITPKEFQKIKRGLIKILAEIEDEKYQIFFGFFCKIINFGNIHIRDTRQNKWF